MSCKSKIELIARYMDGDLSPVESSDLQDHLAKCPRCFRELHAQQRLLELLETEPRDNFRTDLDTSFVPVTKTTATRRKRGWLYGFSTVAAVAAFALWYLPTSQTPDHTVEKPGQAAIQSPVQKSRAANPPANGGTNARYETSPSRNTLHSEAAANTVNHGIAINHAAALVYSEQPKARTLAPATSSNEAVVAVVSAEAPVYDGTGKVIKAGYRLTSGSLVRTGEGGRVTLVTRKGAQLSLDASSELVLDERGVATLHKGRLYCSNHAKEISRINTPTGCISLLGTVLDAAVIDPKRVAVTVVEGKVRLSNTLGSSLVDAGKKSFMEASHIPEPGMPVDTTTETSWYKSRGNVESDYGDIAYCIQRDGELMSEIWTIKADGSDRRRVKTYLGWLFEPGPWIPGSQMLDIKTLSLCWTRPDTAKRRAFAPASYGAAIIDSSFFQLDTATGQDTVFPLPAGYLRHRIWPSPDGSKLAFCSNYWVDQEKHDTVKPAVYVFDAVSGKIDKMLDGLIQSPIAWSPDSSKLILSTGQGYTVNHSLATIDVKVKEVTHLGLKGVDASYSPDGTKIAYISDFKSMIGYYRGAPISGSVWVKDLASDAAPIRVSPEGQGALEPSWSPDGTRILYTQRSGGTHDGRDPFVLKIYVVNPDGTDTRKIYEGESTITVPSWSRSGDSVHVATRDSIVIVAADGSGVRSTLSKCPNESELNPEEEAQMNGAVSDVHEAIYQYALGSIRAFEGRTVRSRECFRKASNLFAGLMWKYPLVAISSANALAYADKAEQMASRTDRTILDEACKERFQCFVAIADGYIGEHKQYPRDTHDILTRAMTSTMYNLGWLKPQDKEHVRMAFECPVAIQKGKPASYIYRMPADGSSPRIGDVIMSCPCCQKRRIIWNENYQRAWDAIKKRNSQGQ